MGPARFRQPCRPRLQRTGAPLLRSRTPLALCGQARNSRRAGSCAAECRNRRYARFRRSDFQLTVERLPWSSADPASLRLFELAQKVAAAPTTLLITGESGMGKDYLARVVHELGPRRDAPFLKIDCASLPPQLVESELFGHERGAFTGAVERKLGRFELGGSGTIVLDEVAALSAVAQSKLLRVLQERSFERLGGTETLHIDARLVALTNVDLPAAVSAGHFREDLFFRMNVLTIAVPPLRERRADVLLLADHFLAALSVLHARKGVQLSERSRKMLAAHSWPGNIRELRNALERAVVFNRVEVLEPEHFAENIR